MKKDLSPEQRTELFAELKERFDANMHRHKGLDWATVARRLDAHSAKVWSLYEMERTGGEPDVVAIDKKSGALTFVDCSAETPAGRRSLCYDDEALESRKEHKPKGSSVGMAAAMGVDMLTEDEYRDLQKLGEFDLKTSSWVRTPSDVRGLGGALFCDRRYGRVFVFHNGAESYYAARGFRASLII